MQKQTEAIQHILPRRDTPSATAAPGTRPPSARHRGRPPVSSRAAPPHVESTPRPACRASRRIAVPPASQPGPRLSRKSTKRPWRGQPRDVGVCSFSGDGKNSVAPSPEEGRVENPKFHFISVPQKPTLSKKEQFPFPLGFQVRGPTVYNPLPPHFHPWPILPAVRGRSASPHISSQSPLGLRELCEDGDHPALLPFAAPPQVQPIVPLEPLARRLEAWFALLSLSRWLTCAIRLGCTIQFTRRPLKFSCVLETSVAAQNAPVLHKEIAVLLAGPSIRDEAGVLQPLLHRTQERRWSSTNPGSASLEPGPAQAPVQDADAQAHDQMHPAPGLGLAAINLKDAYFHVFLYEIQLLLFFSVWYTFFKALQSL